MKVSKAKMAIILVIILAGAFAIVGYFWWQDDNYVSTIDARVSADMANALVSTSGKLVDWNGNESQKVTQDERLGTVEGATAVTSISAPITGTLVKVNVKDGISVSAGQTAAIVADFANTYISANIEETNISKLAIGQDVEIKIDAFQKEKFYGKISSINEAASSVFSVMQTGSSNGNYTKVTQLIPIKIDFVEKYDKNFILGMNAEIKIYIKNSAPFASGKQENENQVSNTSDIKTVSGILSPLHSYNVTAKASGQINTVHVEKGDKVATNDILVIQDSTDIQIQAGQGSTTGELLQRLKNTYDAAEDTYVKNSDLLAEGVISEQVYLQSKTQRDNALLQYQGTLKSISTQTSKAIIKCPGAGTVATISIQKGDYASAGTTIANIVDTSKVILKINVLENNLPLIKMGDKYSVNIDSLSKSFEGEVTFISPISVSSGQLFPIEITIDNTDEELKPGMMGSIELK